MDKTKVILGPLITAGDRIANFGIEFSIFNSIAQLSPETPAPTITVSNIFELIF